MQKVSLKLYATLYKLDKTIQKQLDNMKKQILAGAEFTHKDIANIKVVECQRADYDKEDKAKLDEYAKSVGIAKKITHYKRIDIDNISIDIDAQVDAIVDTLNDSNTKEIKRVASKLNSTK